MQFEEICRACLKEGAMTSIFKTETLVGDRKITCLEMLIACATVRANQNDEFPQQICLQCFKQLSSAYKFRIKCETSFSFLLEYSSNKLKVDGIKTERQEDLPRDDTNDYDESAAVLNVKIEYSPSKNIEDLKVEKDEAQLENDIQNEVCESACSEDYGPSLANCNDSNQSPKEIKKDNKLKDIKESKKIFLKDIKESKKSKQSSNGPFKCAYCPKTFKWTDMLAAHHDSHLEIKRYFCEICQKSYRVEKDHKKMHKRGFKFKCEICAKCFNTKAKLAIHIDTHSSDRERIVCGIDGCKKAFLSINGLERHKVTHTGNKDFICHLCSKRFIDKYQLEGHIRTHTNERPHACGYCNKMFISTTARNIHERCHTNTKNYHCQHCEKSFVSSSGLKRHLLCHSKELLHECRFCGKKFARYDNKKRHEMAMHGVTEEATL